MSAGLMDSNGCFYISKNNNLSCEIIVSLREIQSLYKIKKQFKGSISFRQGSNSYRWRLHKKIDLIYFLNSINGYIYLKTEKFKLVLALFNISLKQNSLSKDNAWFSGFFEGAGCVNISKLNNFQISITVSQKNIQILYVISKIFGGKLYYDNSWNGYLWCVSSLNELIYLFEYFTLFSLYSTKNSDIISAKRIFRYKLLKYHLNPLKHKLLTHFVDIFQKRKKI